MSECGLCISPLSKQIGLQGTKCNNVDRKNEGRPAIRVKNIIIVLITIDNHNKENVVKRIFREPRCFRIEDF